MNVSLTGSYTLEPIQFGFRLNISDFSTAGSYKLTLQDQDDMTERTYSTGNAQYTIWDLKPCTNYSHRLALLLQQSVIYCNQTVNTTATLHLSE